MTGEHVPTLPVIDAALGRTVARGVAADAVDAEAARALRAARAAQRQRSQRRGERPEEQARYRRRRSGAPPLGVVRRGADVRGPTSAGASAAGPQPENRATRTSAWPIRMELDAFLNVVIFIPRGWMSGPLSNGRANTSVRASTALAPARMRGRAWHRCEAKRGPKTAAVRSLRGFSVGLPIELFDGGSTRHRGMPRAASRGRGHATCHSMCHPACNWPIGSDGHGDGTRAPPPARRSAPFNGARRHGRCSAASSTCLDAPSPARQLLCLRDCSNDRLPEPVQMRLVKRRIRPSTELSESGQRPSSSLGPYVRRAPSGAGWETCTWRCKGDGLEKLCVVKRLEPETPTTASAPPDSGARRRSRVVDGAIAQTLAVDEVDGEPSSCRSSSKGAPRRSFQPLRSGTSDVVPLAVHVVREVARALGMPSLTRGRRREMRARSPPSSPSRETSDFAPAPMSRRPQWAGPGAAGHASATCRSS